MLLSARSGNVPAGSWDADQVLPSFASRRPKARYLARVAALDRCRPIAGSRVREVRRDLCLQSIPETDSPSKC